MALKTISYEPGGGFVSEWSYIPDNMIGMNGSFYTWKNGELYQHDTNAAYNTFYGTAYDSQLVVVFNDEPLKKKIFKTLALDSNQAWDVVVNTELNSGRIDASYFVKKEGEWYAYIRRDDNSITPPNTPPYTIESNSALSTLGVGAVSSYAALVITMQDTIESTINVGDTLYTLDTLGNLGLIGVIESISGNTITMTSVTTVPVANDFIICVKSSEAESFSQRGSYMKVTMVNSSTQMVEIFSVATEAEESSP